MYYTYNTCPFEIWDIKVVAGFLSDDFRVLTTSRKDGAARLNSLIPMQLTDSVIKPALGKQQPLFSRQQASLVLEDITNAARPFRSKITCGPLPHKDLTSKINIASSHSQSLVRGTTPYSLGQPSWAPTEGTHYKRQKARQTINASSRKCSYVNHVPRHTKQQSIHYADINSTHDHVC